MGYFSSFLSSNVAPLCFYDKTRRTDYVNIKHVYFSLVESKDIS